MMENNKRIEDLRQIIASLVALLKNETDVTRRHSLERKLETFRHELGTLTGQFPGQSEFNS